MTLGWLLDILVRHRDKLRRLNPDTAETRTLQLLVEERRKFVHEKTRYSNRLTAHLKMYFPQVLDWFDDIGCSIAADFLLRWPTLDALQRARRSTIERFFLDHNSRNAETHSRTVGAELHGCPGDQGPSSLEFLQRGRGGLGKSSKAASTGDKNV